MPVRSVRLFLLRPLWLVLVLLILLAFALGVPAQVERLLRAPLGVVVHSDQAGEFILMPQHGFPAERAGINSGDVLLAVDGQPLPEIASVATVAGMLDQSGRYPILTVRKAGGAVVSYTLSRVINFSQIGLTNRAYAVISVVLDTLLVLTYTLVGVFVFLRRPKDWFAVLASLAVILLAVRIAPEYGALIALEPQWGRIAQLLYFAGGSFLPLLLALFPDGRFVPNWTRYFVLLGFFYSFMVVYFPLQVNPAYTVLGFALDASIVGTGVIVQVYRYRRVADQQQRQQTKWILFGILAGFFGFYGYHFFRELFPTLANPAFSPYPYDLVAKFISYIALMLLPASMAISILLYRLWDIDIFFRRTIMYSIVTVFLGTLYVGIVIVFGQALLFITGARQSEIVIAFSTLATAALFAPFRRRVQEVIDQRYYRRKYDSANVLASFGAKTRDEVELDRLIVLLQDAVQQSIHPENISVWLNPSVTTPVYPAKSNPRPETGRQSLAPQADGSAD
ncbi:MAG TPA: PDZ domain-containing protein [Anaerolineaceae bacterium]|nr:PDZ domain-containing protein [Anaerolineaceae bacterium]